MTSLGTYFWKMLRTFCSRLARDGRLEGVGLDLAVGLLQLPGHQVEGVGELSGLVPVHQVHALRQVGRTDDPAHGPHHEAQRPGEEAREEQQEDDGQERGRAEDHHALLKDLLRGPVERRARLRHHDGPPERPVPDRLGHPRLPGEAELAPAPGLLPGERGEAVGLVVRRRGVRGEERRRPVGLEGQDHLGGAAHHRAREGSDGRLREVHELGPAREAVLLEHVPLAVGVRGELLGLEGEELRGHAGDAVARGVERGDAEEHQRGDDEGEHDEDDLRSDAHGDPDYRGAPAAVNR